ncbi:hypothetical protein FIV00_22345 [Labrenzia sp. THAF82]|uniref:DUF2157 domain-containing protein n=1 Tax=Labrenzia sp. THAF82 TaxID=2587861 RepID=UPI0012A9B91B|nr:DUF2157 domain-containing protein [Labrenzia sp. THAF82]QFT33249.1 hypothetical protein FIV00_22345 [Labrenzia sp. THAF82]
MFDWTYKKRLKDDLEVWVSNGWVKPDGAALILKDQEQGDGRSRLPMVLAGIGMMCVALAVFAFIAANWGVIPKTVKLVGIACLIVASHGLAALAAKGGKRGVADLATGFATLVFVGGMALVGQIFHLPSDWAGGAFLVCLGALVAAWVTGSRASVAVAAIAAITWQVMREDFGEPGLLPGLVGLALLVATFAHSIVYPARLSRWAAIVLFWVTYGRWFAETADILSGGDDIVLAMALAGIGGVAALMVQLDPVADLFVKWSSDRPLRSHGHWLMARSLQDAGIMILCILLVLSLILVPEISDGLVSAGLLALPALVPLALAVLLCVVGLVLSFKTTKALALFAAVGFALFAILVPLATLNVLLLSAFSLAALVGLCALGTWYSNRFWMLCAYLGLTAVALWLLEVTIGSLLGQSLFFLVAGVLLLGVALWLARVFRRSGQVKQSPANEEVLPT